MYICILRWHETCKCWRWFGGRNYVPLDQGVLKMDSRVPPNRKTNEVRGR